MLADASTPSLPAGLETVSSPVTATIDGTEVRIAGAPVGDDYVVVAQAMDIVSDAQRTIILGELLIAPLLLAAVFLGAVLIGRRVAEPIEAARRRQLEFTADASHELRTPLSVIEAHTSLALTQPRDAAWYQTAFVRVDRESKRMRRLLEDMLWLARFDAAHVTPASEPVDLGVIATQAADRFAAVAEARRLELGVHVPAGRRRHRGGAGPRSTASSACSSTMHASTRRRAAASMSRSRSMARGRCSRSMIPGPASRPRIASGCSTGSIVRWRPRPVPTVRAWAWRSAMRSCGRPAVAGRSSRHPPAARGSP